VPPVGVAPSALRAATAEVRVPAMKRRRSTFMTRDYNAARARELGAVIAATA